MGILAAQSYRSITHAIKNFSLALSRLLKDKVDDRSRDYILKEKCLEANVDVDFTETLELVYIL